MQIIKFGGNALQTQVLLENAVGIITSLKKPLIVVVSAIGRKGFPFATDTLIDSLKERKISDKEFDRLLALGEIYASIYLSNACNKNNIKAYALSYHEVGINCDNKYGDGRVDSLCNNEIIELFKEYDVIIVPGFIGASKENEVITLGRNSSDYSAILFASIFKEDKVILYKDVNGIYPTSINSINMKLSPYKNISYDEVKSLYDIGFNVVCQKAIEEAKKNNIKILISNYLTKQEGTCISNVGCNKKILGFNINYDEVKISTLNPELLINELDVMFKMNHIFRKEMEIKSNHIIFKISPNQSVIIKQVLLKYYFL